MVHFFGWACCGGWVDNNKIKKAVATQTDFPTKNSKFSLPDLPTLQYMYTCVIQF